MGILLVKVHAKKKKKSFTFKKIQRIMKKLIHLISLVIGFLCITQIALAQKSSKIIPSTDKTCIPNSLLDSMIHDVQVGKVLKVKDSLSTAQILKLEREKAIVYTSYNDTQIKLLKSDIKRARNGWQRNIFIAISIGLGIFVFK